MLTRAGVPEWIAIGALFHGYGLGLFATEDVGNMRSCGYETTDEGSKLDILDSR